MKNAFLFLSIIGAIALYAAGNMEAAAALLLGFSFGEKHRKFNK